MHGHAEEAIEVAVAQGLFEERCERVVEEVVALELQRVEELFERATQSPGSPSPPGDWVTG
jgi:hypothetical protein